MKELDICSDWVVLKANAWHVTGRCICAQQSISCALMWNHSTDPHANCQSTNIQNIPTHSENSNNKNSCVGEPRLRRSYTGLLANNGQIEQGTASTSSTHRVIGKINTLSSLLFLINHSKCYQKPLNHFYCLQLNNSDTYCLSKMTVTNTNMR